MRNLYPPEIGTCRAYCRTSSSLRRNHKKFLGAGPSVLIRSKFCICGLTRRSSLVNLGGLVNKYLRLLAFLFLFLPLVPNVKAQTTTTGDITGTVTDSSTSAVVSAAVELVSATNGSALKT